MPRSGHVGPPTYRTPPGSRGNPAAAEGSSARVIGEHVRAEQVRTLYSQSAPVLLANVANAVITSAVLWRHAPPLLLVGWTLAMTAMALVRIAMRRRYWAREWSTEEQATWGRRFTIGSLVAGILWGFAGGVLLPESLPHQVVVVFVLGGMAAGAAGTLSCHLPAYYAYLIPAFLPVEVRLSVFGGEVHLAMVAMLALFVVALSLVARNVNHALSNAFRLRFENAALLKQVSEIQESLIEANESLAHSNEALERRVRERTAELRESEQKLAEIVRESPDAMMILDETGRIVSASPVIERITGRRPEMIVGTRLSDTDALEGEERNRAEEIFRRVIGGKRHPPEEFRIRRPDGRTGVVEVNPRYVVGIDRKPCIHTVIRDVTERQRVRRLKEDYEARLRQSQRLESLGLLAGGVAHDFNNVLTIILGNLDALASRPSVDEELKKPLDEIRHASLQASNLTRQLLAFSRQQVLHVEPTDLGGVLEEGQPVLASALGERCTLSISVGDRPCTVLADATQLEQAMINLLVNARHAMPEGGAVTIDARHAEIGKSGDWPDVPPGRYVMVSVADTGMGMDEATCARVFDPFFTTKELGHGTGLGLSTVHGIVTQAGGYIRAKSQLGRGSCFEILLPHHDVTPAEKPRDPAPPRWSEESGTVLVVEDQPLVRRTAERILSAAGYRVLLASDAEQAMRLFRENAGSVDLLLTDVIMPGVSGIELSRRVMELDRDVAVVLVSGYAGTEISDVAELGPRVPFLQKPFDATSLRATVRAAISERRAGARTDRATRRRDG